MFWQPSRYVFCVSIPHTFNIFSNQSCCRRYPSTPHNIYAQCHSCWLRRNRRRGSSLLPSSCRHQRLRWTKRQSCHEYVFPRCRNDRSASDAETAPKTTILRLYSKTAQRVHAFPRFREAEARPGGHGDEPRKFFRDHRCVLSYVLPIKRSLIYWLSIDLVGTCNSRMYGEMPCQTSQTIPKISSKFYTSRLAKSSLQFRAGNDSQHHSEILSHNIMVFLWGK